MDFSACDVSLLPRAITCCPLLKDIGVVHYLYTLRPDVANVTFSHWRCDTTLSRLPCVMYRLAFIYIGIMLSIVLCQQERKKEKKKQEGRKREKETFEKRFKLRGGKKFARVTTCRGVKSHGDLFLAGLIQAKTIYIFSHVV